MAEITAALVKQLRDKTGAAMGDCKKALTETDGDIEKAVDVLRARGVKGSQLERAAAEGAVAIEVGADGKGAALVVLQCETDFAARSDNFRKLLETVAKAVVEHRPPNAEAAKAVPAVARELQEAGAMTVRENIVVARAEWKTVPGDGRVVGYVHHNGTIGVAVAATCPPAVAAKAELEALLRDIAMHATAHDPPPVAVDREGIPADLVARERAVCLKQIDENPADAKKPENIKEKMLEGRMRRFYEERALLEQKFVKDPETSIKQLLERAGKELGGAIQLAWFQRLAVGA